MVCQLRVSRLPVHRQIADYWSASLCRNYPNRDMSDVAAQTREAMDDFVHFLNGGAAVWELNGLMQLLTVKPSLNDVMQVFTSLRAAVREALAEYDAQRGARMSERLDAWIHDAVARYSTLRTNHAHERWADMMKRIAQLNTLSYCTAELNASLDLVSAFEATAHLARVLTGADLCLVFQCVGDVLRLNAHAGEGAPKGVLEIPASCLAKELVVGRHHADAPIAAVRRHLGVPQARAMHSTLLQTNNVTIGKLVSVFFEDRDFTPQEIRVQEIFSGHAAQAIYNAELYERLSQLTAAGERRRIACEMHDTMLQTLISLNINLRVMLNHAQQGDWDGVLPLLEATRHLGKVAVQEGRDTLNSLRETEDCAGQQNLLDALQTELATFAERSGIQPLLTIQGEPLVSPPIGHHLCRLVGEALTNIHRHASARTVRVMIEAGPHELRLEISDDGVGFHPARIDHLKSFGLVGMQERARLMNARLDIHSVPGQGTTISLRCPAGCFSDAQ